LLVFLLFVWVPFKFRHCMSSLSNPIRSLPLAAGLFGRDCHYIESFDCWNEAKLKNCRLQWSNLRYWKGGINACSSATFLYFFLTWLQSLARKRAIRLHFLIPRYIRS
jgi:hypothetical protein